MRLALFFMLLFLSAVALAETTDSKEKLARELVQLLRYDSQMDAYRSQCINTGRAVTPESLAKATPTRFAGITPGSPYWPKVVKAYEQYYRDLCAKPSAAEFLDVITKAYAMRLSIDELRNAIKFYSGPVGKKLVVANKAAVEDVYELVKSSGAVEVPKVAANFDRRLIEISEEAKSAKK